jgi:hypothetical protein
VHVNEQCLETVVTEALDGAADQHGDDQRLAAHDRGHALEQRGVGARIVDRAALER